MRRFIAAVLCVTGCWGLYAKPRTFQDAQQIATEFTGNTGITRKSTTTSVELAYTKNGSSQPLYYVFNRGTGFVIVSADDRATEILGYSDAGAFCMDSLPDNFRSWLGVYDTELEALSVAPEVSVSSTKSTTQTRSTGSSLSPLLGSILWDQGDPYNALCPTYGNNQQSAVGCVATAMAQIMRYHRWPEKGTGTTESYTTGTHNINIRSVNLANTTYDWSNMTPVYTSSSTRTEKNAVATLMYHCGITVEMDYSESSGAYTYKVPNALTTYFSYNRNMDMLSRDYYTKAEWDSIIRNELDNGRPVYYSGYSTTGGHAFVCDGYDADGLFHFNWGWSGLSNGYFALSGLTPASQGIGGSSGGYNFGQDIIIGIQAETMADSEIYQLYMDTTMIVSENQISRNDTVAVTVYGFWNMGARTFTGRIGTALFDTSGNIVCTLETMNTSLETYYGYLELTLDENTVPSSVPEGDYRLYLVYQAFGATDYQIVRAPVGTPNYLDVNVSSSRITFSSAGGFDVDLQLDTLETIGNLYQDKVGRFRYTITNNGMEYVSVLAVRLESITESDIALWGNLNPVSIAKGDTLTFEIEEDIDLAPGEYYLSLFYDAGNSYANLDDYNALSQLGDTLTVTVLETPTGEPDLQLLAPIALDGNVDRNDLSLTASIVNRGDYFSGNVTAFIFNESGQGNSLDYVGYQTISMDAEETRDVTFSGAVSLDAGTYFLALYYYDGGWQEFTPEEYNGLTFTLIDPTTALQQTQAGSAAVYPNPAKDVVNVRSAEKVLNMCVYDLSGRLLLQQQPGVAGEIQLPVSGLQAGTYTLVLRTENATTTTKIIKH